MSEDYGANFITLTDDEGNEFVLEYVDALEKDGVTYMAFFPAVEDEADEESDDYGLVILKSVVENGDPLRSRRSFCIGPSYNLHLKKQVGCLQLALLLPTSNRKRQSGGLQTTY